MTESEGIIDNQIAHSADPIDSRYDEGYFHGRGSGYSHEGYEKEHADWSELIQWVQLQYEESIRWLDLGCAYGYLIEQAGDLGVEAFGLDISSYALRQVKKVRGRAIRGRADRLPFLPNSFDVVSLFDVIEHLENPNAVMELVESVLKPEGICFLSTPDPIHFNRTEPTHIHEHPPSCWVDWLRDRGWQTAIRFGGQPYELEIAACRQPSDAWQAIRKEFPSQRSSLADAISLNDSNLYFVLRSPAAASNLGETTSFYLLNASKTPMNIAFSLIADRERHPDVFVGDLKLRYGGQQTTDRGIRHCWNPVSLPPGGHDVTVRVEGEPIPVVQLGVEAAVAESYRFLEELPFDHFQRYRFVTDLLNQISHESLSVLDVGGALGYLHLFASRHRITVLDRVWEDWPGSLSYTDSVIPFGDQSFDVVVSVDTLEHIPVQERNAFLAELCRLARHAVLLCGPFNEPSVTEAEWALREYLDHHLQQSDRFLSEHALYSLPNRAETLQQFRDHRFSTMEFANGYLPRWLAMQMASFTLSGIPELREGARQVNALYNRHCYEIDNQYPCYRTVIAAFRGSIPGSLHAIRSRSDSPEIQAGLWPLADLIVSLSMVGVLREKDLYLDDQGERLERFLDHLKNLELALQEERKHAANLETYLAQNGERLNSLQKHGDNLQRLLDEQKKERENFLALVDRGENRNEELLKHCTNLETLLQSFDKQLKSMQDHASNLEKMLKENQKHSHNLETLIQQQEKQFRETVAPLGVESAGSILDGLPHLASRMNRFMQDNRSLQQDLQAIQRTRMYRILRKLGWTPTSKESRSG